MKTILFLSALLVSASVALGAEPLTQSTFTEVVKDVNVVAASTKATTPAAVSGLVRAPDLVRTGPDSRAEMTAPDNTITRIGANTVFSFEPSGRDMNLEKGSVLFHSPAGRGGGTIRSGGAAAAVLGTTIIVSSTGTGGFKVIVLEGKGTVRLPNGNSAVLHAGQLVFVLPGQTKFGQVLEINLGKLVSGSNLVNGFSSPLPSMPLIQVAIIQQNNELKNGKVDTGMPPIPNPNGNGLNTIDPVTYRRIPAPVIHFNPG